MLRASAELAVKLKFFGEFDVIVDFAIADDG